MNLSDLLAALRRHWVVAIACLVATAAVAGLVYLQVPVYYQAQRQMIVLSPAARATVEGDSTTAFNPYLTAGDGPSVIMASTLERIAASPGFELELIGRGVSSEATVAVATGGGGVVLELVTINQSSATSRGDLEVVTTLLDDTLQKLQLDRGSPENQLLTVQDLVPPSEPIALPGDRLKLTAIAGVLGLVLTALVITVLASRARRRPAIVPPASLAPGAAAPPPAPDTPVPGAPNVNRGRRSTDVPEAMQTPGRGRRVTDVPEQPKPGKQDGAERPRQAPRVTASEETVALPKMSNGRLPAWPEQHAPDSTR